MVAREIPTSSTGSFTPQDTNSRQNFMELMAPVDPPQTELARHRIFAPKAGVRVSPLALGAMSLGDQWSGFMGSAVNKEKAFEILDAFYEAGGNFVDTANNYQDEQSEVIIGEWMEERGIRDEIVLSTKYTTFATDRADGKAKGIRSNFFGNHKKSLAWSVERSLKKLKTDYIDILFLHWWDYSTSIEEVMLSLNDLVRSGKVLYLGVSDTPAWIVAQANQYARDHALAQFVVYQGKWSVADREVERDVIPMCKEFGMAFLAWNVLGGGFFKTPEELKERASTLRGGMQPSENQLAVAKQLAKVAEEVGAKGNLTGVALAWARQKYVYTYPLVGGAKVSHLKGNIDALTIKLSAEQIQSLDNAIPFDPGFPANFFGTDPRLEADGVPKTNALINTSANLKYE